jgi:Tol biopolymer transport system component
MLAWLAAAIVSACVIVSGSATAEAGASSQELISFWRGGPGTPSIWLMRPDGSGRREIHGLPAPAKRGELSPDARRIVFDGTPPSGDTFAFDIYVARLDGTGMQRLTCGPDRETSPHWSPDGRAIVFQRARGEGQPPSIWRVGADGRGLARVTDGSAPIWSADGRRLAFARATPIGGSSSDDIYVGSLAGGPVRLLVSTPYDEYPTAWSQDGRQLLFTRVSRSAPRSQVFVLEASVRRSRAITSPPRGSRDFAAAWSPDGHQVLFTRVRDRAYSERGQIFVVNSSGARLRGLSQNSADEYATSWRAIPD